MDPDIVSLSKQAIPQGHADAPVEPVDARWPDTLRALWKDAIVLFLATRVGLLIVGLLATFYIMPLLANNPLLSTHAVYGRFPQALWLMWQHFDSGPYLSIAQHGYASASTSHNLASWGFYPLYPLLVAGVGFLLGSSATSYTLAGLLISNGAAVVGVSYLFLLLCKDFGRLVAARSVLYLSLFPLGFYLSAISNDALFLMLCIMSLYYARRQRWWLTGLCGGLAALAHVWGIILIIPLTWEILRATSERYTPPAERSLSALKRIHTWLHGLLLAGRKVQNWLTILPLLLIPTATLSFMLYARLQTGDLLATFHSDRWDWGRNLPSPRQTLISSLFHPTMGEPLSSNFWIFNIALLAVFLSFTFQAWRKLPPLYALYIAGMVLIPLFADQFDSLGRCYLAAFPTFILLAFASRNETKPVHAVIVGILSTLQAVFMVFFVLGIPAIS